MAESLGVLTEAFSGVAAPNAALAWSDFGSAGTYISCSVGTCAAMGTGDFTIAGLVKPSSTRGCLVGLWSSTGSAYRRGIMWDSGFFASGGDFGPGYNPPGGINTSGTKWQWIIARKQAGSNNIQWSWKNLTDGSAIDHGVNGFNMTDPGAVTDIRIGQAEVEGRGAVAVVGLWKRFLSTGEADSLMTNNLADLRALSPDALLPCNVAAASVVDTTGNGANAASVAGTITAVAGPVGFSF